MYRTLMIAIGFVLAPLVCPAGDESNNLASVSENAYTTTAQTNITRSLKDILNRGVYDVRDFGAIGDAVTDDTAAIQAAINAACDTVLSARGDWSLWRGHGGVVYFPPGIYRTSDTLYVYSGNVGLLGAGVWSTAIFLDTANSSTDAVSISRGRAPPGKPTSVAGGAGGFIRDMSIGMKRVRSGRDGVRIDVWGSFDMNNVWIQNPAGTGIWIGNLVLGTFKEITVKDAGTGLRIGKGSNKDYSTVLSFDNFHVSHTSGHGLDGPQCFGCTFTNSVFEAIGAVGSCSKEEACVGVAVGQGEWSFFHPYFEANKSWDLDLAALVYSGDAPTVGVYNYTGRSQPGQKISGTGGVYIGDRIWGGGLFGAWWLDTRPAVKIRSGAKSFPLLGLHTPINETNIVYAGAGGIRNYPGLIHGTDSADVPVQEGAMKLRVRGGSRIWSSQGSAPNSDGNFRGDIVFNSSPQTGKPIGWVATADGKPGTWAAMPDLGLKILRGSVTQDVGTIAANSCANFTIAVAGASGDEPCALSMPAAQVAGVIGSCWVTAADTVNVRVCNVTTFPVNPARGSYTVKVIKG